jgi:hypothetical protein
LTIHNGRPRARLAPHAIVALALALALVLVLAGCGSAAPPGASAVRRACRQISAVLKNGPDPDAHPAGHLTTQILPLQQIHPADRALRRAVSELAGAYRQFFDGAAVSTTAKQAVVTASAKIDSLCPGAAVS